MTDQTKKKKSGDYHTVRDTVEGIWVAIVLALVLRAFVVEAFVIPTGSMAPRLMGEHYDLQCPSCGYEYAFGWVNVEGARARAVNADLDNPSPARGQKSLIRSQPDGSGYPTCPNCSYDYPRDSREYINAGDRVLVMKYLYHFQPPQPWDVVVFRNPQNNRENYIKRLIGTPGETIEIIHGDVFYKSPATDSQWRVRRKTPKAQEAVWQVVNENDYLADPQLVNNKRWEPAGAFKGDSRQRIFSFEGGQGELAFAYQTNPFLPTYGYNALPSGRSGIDFDQDIVTDLKLECIFQPAADDSQVSLELSSFQHRFRATVQAGGAVRVEHALSGEDQWETWSPTGLTVPAMQARQGHRLALSNADFQLTFMVDGKAIFQSTDQQYSGSENPHDWIAAYMRQPRPSVPKPVVKISAAGGASLLSHLSIMRDVYYTRVSLDSVNDLDPTCDYARSLGVRSGDVAWGVAGSPITLNKFEDNPDLDSFFVLGDNSPASLDGRAWVKASPTLRLWKNSAGPGTRENALYQLGTVPRYNMIGKAFFVYWPSGFRVPGASGLPVIPNIGRIRLIR